MANCTGSPTLRSSPASALPNCTPRVTLPSCTSRQGMTRFASISIQQPGYQKPPPNQTQEHSEFRDPSLFTEPVEPPTRNPNLNLNLFLEMDMRIRITIRIRNGHRKRIDPTELLLASSRSGGVRYL